MNTGNACLKKLMERVERAWAKDQELTASIAFTESTNPEYLNIKRADEKQNYHGVLLNAESHGAINIEWDVLAGHHNQIKRITLQDHEKLAALINEEPRWDKYKKAYESLSLHFDNIPIITQLMDAWKNGKSPRSVSIDDLPKVLNAIKIIQYCSLQTDYDIPIRTMSARIGFDTKKIESLLNVIDLLISDDLETPAKDKDEILANLGVIRFPSPLLISGDLTLALNSNEILKVTQPYLGVPPLSVNQVELGENVVNIVTIENLTTFHQAINSRPAGTVILYTNGMPSTSWRRFYKNLLDATNPSVNLYHWGDIDAGGFRIAKNISLIASQCGKSLKLHNMNPVDLPENYKIRELEKREIDEISLICAKQGWMKEMEGIMIKPVAYEQEILELSLP